MKRFINSWIKFINRGNSMQMNEMPIKKGRTKVEIIDTIFNILKKEDQVVISRFMQEGLDNDTTRDYIKTFNHISKLIKGDTLIESIKAGRTTIVRLKKVEN
jgi:predicted transcriptional regulator